MHRGSHEHWLRLLRDIVQASGIVTWVDTTHGTTDLHLGTDDVVLVTSRNPVATLRSWEAGWKVHPEAIDPRISIAEIAGRYPHAKQVAYEDLCADLPRVICDLAAHRGIEPWPSPVATVSQNAKWFSGIGGPQLGAGAPFNANGAGQTTT